jgi:transcriptional regulator with XRE-family HTH domain
MAKKMVVPRFKRTRPRMRTFFREWRKYRKMTLEVAAEEANMTAGNLSNMERSVQAYTQDGLEALAHVYGCSPGQLLTVDPTKDDAIWSIWETAKTGERQMIVDIARTVIKRGTG